MLIGLLLMVCSGKFLDNSGPPAQGWERPQWVAPNHVDQSSRKRPTELLTGCPYKGIFSVEIPFFQLTLVSAKLTKTNHSKKHASVLKVKSESPLYISL